MADTTANSQQTAGGLLFSPDTSKLGRNYPQLLESAVGEHSEKTAVICSGVELSYDRLNAQVNRMARLMRKQGIGRGDTVGIALDRFTELVVAMLAVLKSGAVYLPLDPELPSERIRQMMEDASPKLVLVSDSAIEAVCLGEAVCWNIHEIRDKLSSEIDCSNLDVSISTEDTAYIIYTSGTTGKPKGVEVHHEALCNYILSKQQTPGCNHTDRILALSTISFDMSISEILVPLVCGATVVIAETNQRKSPRAILQLMEQHAITMISATPTMWQMVFDIGWQGQPRLGTIMIGGEAVTSQIVERLLDCADAVWNVYGPTETTAAVTAWKVQRGEKVILGQPFSNTRLYVLDENLSPAAVGQPGELYIAGTGVSRGYRKNPEATKAKFVKDPFHKGIMYRTGDLACLIAPQKLSLLGRADRQIKVRGYRIEPGEVEAAIITHESISRAVVISRKGQMMAYCIRQLSVTDTNQVGAENGAKVALGRVLRPWLLNRLPAYMVPAFFVSVDEFPLTISRKIDENALPSPLEGSRVEATPATELQRHILKIWTTVLGHAEFSVDDSFFLVGGDSARVVRVQSEVKKLTGKTVPLAKFYEYFTIKTLAAYLAGTELAKSTATPLGLRIGGSNIGNVDIALVSMACRLPGEIATPDDLWDVLENERDTITEVPKERWDAEAIYDANPDAHGKSYSRGGGFASSVDEFDASFFGISPREARALDPTHSLMLEVGWEAFERAGYTNKLLRGVKQEVHSTKQVGYFFLVVTTAEYVAILTLRFSMSNVACRDVVIR